MRASLSGFLQHPLVVSGIRWTHRGLLRVGLASVAASAKRVFRRAVADEVIIMTPDGRALGGSVDHLAQLSNLASGTYEAGTLAEFRAAVRPGARVLDLGANIGAFTTLAALEVGPTGQVIAVEPDERNLRHLRANLRRQGVDNVEVMPHAVAGVTGTARFHQASVPTNSTLYPELLDAPPTSSAVNVRTITVDDLLAGRTVDIIKMDVEGAEWVALDGMTQTLERNPDVVLFVEFEEGTLHAFGTSPEALISRLRSRFAQVLVVDEEHPALVDPDSWRMQVWQNLLCAPSSFVPFLPSRSQSVQVGSRT